jgi:hypothetical protein
MNLTPSKWTRTALIALVQVTALQAAALRAQDHQGAGTPSATQRQSYEQATRDFRERRFAAAYGRFAQLADAGHVPSACIALLMVRDGRALFVTDWYATPDQLRRWSALAIQAARTAPPVPADDET